MPGCHPRKIQPEVLGTEVLHAGPNARDGQSLRNASPILPLDDGVAPAKQAVEQRVQGRQPQKDPAKDVMQP